MVPATPVRPPWIAEKNSRYYESVRWDLIALIPPGCRTFLDIGCGDGVTGKAIREKFPSARVVGIEVHPEAARRAAQVLDRVILGEVGSALAEIGDLRFDCLLFGDILEHLVDPWGSLQEYARLLNPEGVVVISLPNIQHYSVIFSLIRGNWTYRSRGLLDQTHLRFFTYRESLHLLQGAGLAPLKVRYNLRLLESSKSYSKYAGWIARVLPFLRPYLVFQYLFLAAPQKGD